MHLKSAGFRVGAVTIVLGLVFVGGNSLSAAVDVTRTLFTPVVVPENYAQPVRFEATVTGGSASVAFRYDGVDRPMFDDGTHGDRVAGDGVWTIQFQPSEILGKLTTAQVFRPFIGYCIPAGGPGQFNIFAEVSTSAIGSTAVRAIDASAQQADYVVNFTATAAQLANPDSAAMTWAQRFYSVYGDKFDFLNFVLIGGKRDNRHHSAIKNDVRGIGLSLSDQTASYGSAGRLKGWTMFPLSYFFDGAGKAFCHEIGHQWVNHLSGTSYASGIPHWPKGDIAASGIMGLSIPGSGAGGEYLYTFTANGQGGYVVGGRSVVGTQSAVGTSFNSMELYLMGLAAPSEVGDFFVLNDQNQNVTVGQTLQSTAITVVSVNSVIAVVGQRVPDSTTSQKNFRSAFIVLSEQLLDATAMSFFDWFARRAEATQSLTASDGFSLYTTNPFYLATGSRATMVALLNDAPSVSQQPTNQIANAGQSVTFAVGAGGELPLSYQWQRSTDGGVTWSNLANGSTYAGVTTPVLTIGSTLATMNGDRFRAVTSNSFGTATSNASTLTTNVTPSITTQPLSQTVSVGTAVTFSVVATGAPSPSYQWRRNGVNISGATAATFTLGAAQSSDAASYTVVVSNANGSVTSSAAVLTVTPYNPGRIINLSILTSVTASEPTFTVGTVTGGAGTAGQKALLIRAVGPSLTPLGVTGALADPAMSLFSGQTQVSTNDNWGGSTAISSVFTQVGAFAYASPTSRDSALSGSFLAGGYTVQIRGVGGATGTVLAELYDATPPTAFTATTPRLINVSVLKQINAGDMLTAGFVIGGATSKTVLIRAVGPTLGLAPFNVGGVMADPKLDLFSGQTVINSNDNWGGDSTLAAAFVQVGAFALANAATKDAALLVTLSPGNYTAQVSGVGGTGGLALVEVYEVP